MAITLDISLGAFLVIILVITELVINPIRKLFKDELLFCSARHVVAKGSTLQVRTVPKIFRAVGFEAFISNKGVLIFLVSALKVGTIVFILISIALWERTVQQLQVSVIIPVETTSLFNLSSEVPQGRTFLMSPFPVIGLRRADVVNFTAFNQDGSGAHAPYKVREKAARASQYASSCVITPNDTHTVVFFGAVIRDHNKKSRSMCLDGAGSSSLLIAATFETVSSSGDREVRSITILSSLSTDNTTVVYSAQLTDEKDNVFNGYIAFSLRTYFHANSERSFYGLFRQDGSTEVWRLSLPLTEIRSPNPQPWGETVLGTWQVNTISFKAPSGQTFKRPQHLEAVFNLKPLQRSGFFLYTDNAVPTKEVNSDLLAWMVEIDYARFWAAQTFSKELRERVRADRMFYSAYNGQTKHVVDGSTRESVSVGSTQTIVLLIALGLLLVQILASFIWGCLQRRTNNIRSEIVSYEALAAMYKAHVAGEHTVQGGRTSFQLGLQNIDEDVESLGIVTKGSSTPPLNESFLRGGML